MYFMPSAHTSEGESSSNCCLHSSRVVWLNWVYLVGSFVFLSRE